MSAEPNTNPEPKGTPLPVEWLDFVQASAAEGGALGAPVDTLSDDELTLRLSVMDSGFDSTWSTEPKGHTQRLAALRRAAAQVRALESLVPKPAPFELDGLVVASLHSGARQDRAVQQVQALASQPVPRELDEAVARMVIGDYLGGDADTAPGPFRAPGVLDRLVEESLSDPLKANAKSMTSRLGRQGAPDELTERVQSQLQRGDQGTPAVASASSSASDEPIGARSVAAALVSMGLAAILVVTIAVRGNQESPSSNGDAPAEANPSVALADGAGGEGMAAGGPERVARVRLEVVMLDEDNLSDDDRNMLRLLGGAL